MKNRGDGAVCNQAERSSKIYLCLRIAFVAFLVLVYFLNLFTPLRLTHDTIRYLDMKEWMESGFPPDASAAKDFLPYGYSTLLLLLSKMHAGKSFFIVLVNLLYFLGALRFIKKTFADTVGWWQLLLLALLNWTSIKFVITPLSEMQYLFFSSGALYYFLEYRRRGSVRYLAGALLFFSFAMLTRAIGFAIGVAGLAVVLSENNWAFVRRVLKNKISVAVILAGAAGIALFSRQLRIGDYFGYFIGPLTGYGFVIFFSNIWRHMTDWAEIFLNVPMPKITFINALVLKGIYSAVGLTSLAVILGRLFRKAGDIPLVLRYYLVIYIAIVFSWPFFETRFWLPVMPFLLVIGLNAGKRLLTGNWRYFIMASVLFYALMGVSALAYYTYSSYNKTVLATKQDASIWRNEYETFFFGKPLSDSAAPVRKHIVYLLEKYN